MRLIRTEDIKAACRKAIADGTLAAMHGVEGQLVAPTPNSGSKCYCALGATLDPSELDKCVTIAACTPYSIHRLGIVAFEDRHAAAAIMGAHDRWAAREHIARYIRSPEHRMRADQERSLFEGLVSEGA